MCGEVFAADGDFFAVEDDTFFSGLGAPNEPEFVVEDEGIEEKGFAGIVDNDVLGVAGKFFVLELGGVFAFLGFQGGFESFCGLFKGLVGLGDLGDQLRSIATFSLFTLG